MIGIEPFLKFPTKLERIITPLVIADLHKLFSGAPQFFVRSNHGKHWSALPKPCVEFPWDTYESVRDLHDHFGTKHPAWAFSTTASEDYLLPEAEEKKSIKRSTKFNKVDVASQCRELPNMLSKQGLEKGSVAYRAALEMSVSDRLAKPDFTPWEVLHSYRTSFLQRKDKLRPIPNSTLLNKLIAIENIYQSDFLHYHKTTFQLYTDLFTKILFPSPQILDIDDIYSLKTQIYHLVEVLNDPNIWIDFRQIKRRVEIGQILWGSGTSRRTQTFDSLDTSFGSNNSHSQKYWLLLQILLGCETILRLDILSNKIRGDRSVPLEKMDFFGQRWTDGVYWTLLLARTWMENISLKLRNWDEIDPSWAYYEDSKISPHSILNLVNFNGRHRTRQISGLLHFAQELQWPNLEKFKYKMSIISRSNSEHTINRRSRQGLSRTTSCREVKKFDETYDEIETPPNKWLSDSYMSGLILPGETISQLLILTLLENDPHVPDILRNKINPNGAFIYGGKSFWSTFNIVGKVLAASNTSSECMEWISTKILPRGVQEGWISIGSQPIQQAYDCKKPRKARIWHKKTIERHGNVIAGADDSSILRGDFVLPSEKPTDNRMSVKFLSLDMFASDETVKPTLRSDYFAEFRQTYNRSENFPLLPTMRFNIDIYEGSSREISIDLVYDIIFITAHPCKPSLSNKILDSPTNPIFQSSLDSPATQQVLGHPLHKAFTYTRLPLLHILNTSVTTDFSTLLTPPTSPNLTQSSLHTTSSNIPKILVIDCTEEESEYEIKILQPESAFDKEMLARAICAERGWNALLSRKTKCCLACSIREASALGYRVIIRL